eukprot:Em0005g1558a
MASSMFATFESNAQALSKQYAVPIDQVRFLTLLLLGYPLGALYRYGLHPSRTSLTARHVFSTSLGILFGLLCFGWSQMFLLFFMTGVCYAMLLWLPTTVVHLYTVVFAMVCVSMGHVYRMLTDYEGWNIDFSLPLMVMVQRVSLTAFALNDGIARADSDNEQKLTEVPSLLEYWSYNYNFHTFLAGPACTMKEYLNFVDGSNFTTKTSNRNGSDVKYPVLGRLSEAVVCVVLHQVISAQYPIDSILKPDYSLPTRILLAHIIMFHVRSRYYFVWLLVESINNFIGLGFGGYDKEGKPVWDVCKNVKPWDVEFGTNFRSVITGWNVTTSLWLRRICYNRVSYGWISPILASWVLSAVWHGFYPGYYFCFLSGAIMQAASVNMRRLLWNHFQTSETWRRIYDVATWATSHTLLNYGAMCFVLLSVEKCWKLWKFYYFFPLIIVSCAAWLPVSHSKKEPQNDGHRNGTQMDDHRNGIKVQ